MGQINIVNACYGGGPSVSEKLFILFVFIAICIVLVRIGRLTLRLLHFGRRQIFSCGHAAEIDKIARAVLKGRFKIEPLSIAVGECPQTHFIDTRFYYLWETCRTSVRSTKMLALLVAMLALSIAAVGCINICSGLMTEETAGIMAAARGIFEVFVYLAIGFLAASFFYSVSLLFTGILARRMRDWNYLKARLKDEITQ